MGMGMAGEWITSALLFVGDTVCVWQLRLAAAACELRPAGTTT